MTKPLVSIIMGSDSDLLIVKDAAIFLDGLGISNQLTILSAHRTPDELVKYIASAEKNGTKVFIAAAGGAAHLAGVVAAHSALPVIGIPILSKTLEGLDSLLSTAQMPAGVPVATVGINGAKNAGILAAQIIGSSNPAIFKKIIAYKAKIKEEVLAKAERLEKTGFQRYLEGKGPL